MSNTVTETKLEDMIDEPIKKCAALLNLLECKTQFSCCGYDYKDQSAWKAHTKGQIYFFIEADDRSFQVMQKLQRWSFTQVRAWQMRLMSHPWNESYWHLACIGIQAMECWQGKIHEYEGFILSIQHLEDALIEMKDEMADEVTVKDFNARFIEHYGKKWEFTPGADWVVRKEDYV